MGQENNSAFEPMDSSNEQTSRRKPKRNFYTEDTCFKVGNIFVLIQGVIQVIYSLYFVIAMIAALAAMNAYEVTNDEAGNIFAVSALSTGLMVFYGIFGSFSLGIGI